MPTLKTHSGSKKRFKITARGGVKAQPSGKRHNMRKRSRDMKRNARGMTMLTPMDARIIVKNFLRNG